jgi:hypothetical protein
MWPSRGSFFCPRSGSSSDVWEAVPPLAWLRNTLLALGKTGIAPLADCHSDFLRSSKCGDRSECWIARFLPPRRHCQTNCTYGQLSETDTLGS